MELIGITSALLFARFFSAGWGEFDRFLFTLICLGVTALGLAAVRF